MNREIKFRVWAKHPITDKYEMKPVGRVGLSYVTEHDTFPNRIIMQFTGLLDKNKTPIYEGDLIKHYNCDKYTPVTFSNGCFMWGNEPLNYNLDDTETPVYSTEIWAEVAGNIYENPELLTTL